jgi:hypothetical protein
MKISQVRTALLATALAIACGCASPPDLDQRHPHHPENVPPEGARLNQSNAIEIARQSLQRRGYAGVTLTNPAVFYLGRQQGLLAGSRNLWLVIFNPTAPATPPGPLGVYVNDRTHETEVFGATSLTNRLKP